jgi:hypothetical protein
MPQKGADYYTYSLTVEHENQSHSGEVSEPAVPATLRPLIRYLMNRKKGYKN